MAQLTLPRDTPQYGAHALPDFLLDFPVDASSQVFQGGIVAINAAGHAVPANATAGVVVGLATASKKGGAHVGVRQGCFHMANASGADRVTAGMVGRAAFIVDDQTVAAAGTVKAGTVYGVDDSGVWVQFLLSAP